MHYMITDNELIFGQNRKYQMAFGSYFVTVMHIFVTLWLFVSFVIHTLCLLYGEVFLF